MQYIKWLDPDSDFYKSFEIQRHIKRSFFEEFKINSFNYIMLLFGTFQKLHFAMTFKDIVNKEEPSQNDILDIMGQNYKRFLGSRGKEAKDALR